MLPKTQGYSIWLVPKEEIYKKFSDLIKKLSSEHKTPQFEPHLTLLGGIFGNENEVIKKTEKISNHARQFQVTLDKIDDQDFFFRSLFLLAEKTDDLMLINKKAQDLFFKNEEYMPHLSILYSNLTKEEKKEIIDSLDINLPIIFSISQIVLLKTEGTVENWTIVSKFDLI